MLQKISKKIILAMIAVCSMVQAFAGDFPVTFEHKFGTTTIEKKPVRIATLDVQGADDLLALGVQPVAIKYWYGDYEKTVWPWAQDKLTTTPVVIKKIDFEKIASSKPDVILAVWARITDKDYEKLTKIAPVVVGTQVGKKSVSWDQRAIIAGRAIGKEKEAQEQVDAIKAKIEKIAKDHPEWKGKTTAIPYLYKGSLGAYGEIDMRTDLLLQLGFVYPKQLSELSKGHHIEISEEKIQMLDLDLLVWLISDEELINLKNHAGHSFLNVYKDKREVFLDDLEASAFSHSSLLSLPFVLDKLVVKIEGALNKK